MSELIILRNSVDELDRKLIEIVKKRLILSREIGNCKRKNGLKIIDRKREKEVIENRLEKSSLDSKFVKKLFKLILNESRRVQKKS